MKESICLWFVLGVFGYWTTADNLDSVDLNETFFISEIFNKYGNNNVITYEGFEHLLENLGLGRLKFETQHDVSIHKINGTFREFHDELSLHKHNHNGVNKVNYEQENSRRKRNVVGEGSVEKTLKRKCLTVQDILRTYGLAPYHDVVISPSKYLEICPAIVYELDQKLCEESKEEEEVKQGENERYTVWINASISVIVMGVSGMLCVLLVPLMRRDHYSSFLQFLVALAAGTLCGDALIHLIPQVFSVHDKQNSGVITVSKGTVTLLAIYVFFIIESVLMGLREKKQMNAEDSKEMGAMIMDVENHGHSHGVGKKGVKTVAWMAILGDILHNVTDGLSIGAAFGLSFSSGLASSIAIFCHELPHELGDYAILLSNGMSVKKSLFYNVVSSVFSFVGMSAGVLLGEIHNASLWINAFTAGSFLYIALSDLIPEMKLMQSNPSFKTFMVQTIGLACGGILMFGIALYEDQIENLF